MAYHGDWPKELEKRLKNCWQKAKGDRDEFQKLVLADKAFKEKGWNACERKARRTGFFKKAKMSKRYVFSQLNKKQFEEVKGMLADDNTYQETIQKCSEFGLTVTEQQLRNLAKSEGIKLNKGQPGRKAAEAKPESKRSMTPERRLQGLIYGGKLAELGADNLFDLVNQEFPNQQTRQSFDEKLQGLIWDTETLGSLEDVVKRALPLDRFLSYHRHIPPQMVELKAKELTGVSKIDHPVAFIPGLGRISGEDQLANTEEIELPRTSFNKPLVIKVADADKGNLMIVNGPNIGLRHDRRIRENPVRRALADARRRRDSVIFIVNPIDIDTTKAGGAAKVHRALVSGRNVNIKVLEPSYQDKAKRILEGSLPGELIFETFAEVFENIVSGYWKITHRADGSPEYDGEIKIVFGRNEEELIAAAAYWEVRYWTIRKQNNLDVEIKMAKNALARAEKEGDGEEVRGFSEKLEELLREKSRTIVSNINTEDIQKTYRRIHSFVVRRFEETIPNCKVIGHGSVYVKIGKEVIEIHIPEHLRITDTLLVNYTDHYGPKVLRQQFADTVVICHPYALNYRMTAREVDSEGKRGSSQVHVAPIAVDGDFLRDVLRDNVRKLHPISRLVFKEQFQPGVLRLSWVNGIVSGESTPVNALGAYKRFAKKEDVLTKKSLIGYPDCPFIWLMFGTDPHWGSRAKEFVWCEKRNSNLGVCEAAIEMMREAGLCRGLKMPIHMFAINDDPTQGNHFETHKQPDPHQMPYGQIERGFEDLKTAILKGAPAERKEAATRLQALGLSQLLARGLDWPQHQLLEVFFQHLQPNVDFFNAVLSRATRAGLLIKGVSDFERTLYDSRDIGMINIGSGNHFGATVDWTLTEGFIYAIWLIGLLSSFPNWRQKPNLLPRLIKAPLYGNEHIGWGTIQIPNGYEWGIEFRSSPARLASWGDTLLGAVRNDERRANYSRIFDGKMALKVYGDKHFFGAVSTEHTFYHMCAAGTHTDVYGERGFPPNNTGVSFVGLPVNGPDSGPILVRTLRYDRIRDYFKRPYRFNWTAFLPNPA